MYLIIIDTYFPLPLRLLFFPLAVNFGALILASPLSGRSGPRAQDSIQGHNIQKLKVRSRENLTSRRTGLTGFGVRLVKMVPAIGEPRKLVPRHFWQ